jgi:hypothetical protein
MPALPGGGGPRGTAGRRPRSGSYCGSSGAAKGRRVGAASKTYPAAPTLQQLPYSAYPATATLQRLPYSSYPMVATL